MTILLTGCDGYQGWPMLMRLGVKYPDEKIIGVDNFTRRHWVAEVGSWSAIPIYPMDERIESFKEFFKLNNLEFRYMDLTNWSVVDNLIREEEPRTIVHYAAQPSAPYSMIDAEHAIDTQMNNVKSTLNLIHSINKNNLDTFLIETTTMGVYGTPNIDITDELLPVEFRGRKDTLPFPAQAGSWYHWSKVHDANNLLFAYRVYGMNVIDLRLGIVHGTRTEESERDKSLATRFDFDFWFGTLFNRFAAQCVAGFPLTIYGEGGQTRGYISLEDTIRVTELAVEAEKKGYNLINTFLETASVKMVAEKIQEAGKNIGLNVELKSVPNPRKEAEKHYYNPSNEKMFNLGFKPKYDLISSLEVVLKDLPEYKERIVVKKDKFLPKVLREKL